MNDMYDNIEDKKSREEYTMLSKYRIKELRNNANISQDKLSEIIGVSRIQIIRWEKITKDNDAVIDSLYKNRMCRYFRVPFRKLYNCEYQEIVDIAKKDATHIMQNDLTNVINSLSELMTQASNTECTKDTLDSIEDKLYEIVKLGKYDIFVLFDFLSERVPKLEAKQFKYIEAGRSNDYSTKSSPEMSLARAINRILDDEYELKSRYLDSYRPELGNQVTLTLKATVNF